MANSEFNNGCPSCSSLDFVVADMEGKIVIVSDRVCEKCGTHYTPPIPKWMPTFMVAGGVILILFFGWLTYFEYTTALPRFFPLTFIGYIAHGVYLLFAVTCIVWGAKLLASKKDG